MGSKVDVEAPTITVLSPASGEFLRDTVTFTGEATAYRDLRRSNGEYSNAIQVMILDQNDESTTYLPWTTIGTNIQAHGQRAKTWVWNYNLDTTNFDDTLFLKIKFRVYDESSDPNRKPSETIQLVYVVKNKPSSVKLSSPSQLNLDNENNELTPQVLVTGTDKINGQVTDRRGIKPGYPRIKFWVEDQDDPLLGEPFRDNDPNFGWATLFLDDLDDPAAGTGTYTDRTDMPVVNSRGFAFRLWDYSIEVDSRNPDLRKIKYDRSGGDPRPLAPGKRYRFRIKTSDTFFDVQDMTPRAPEGDEKEAIGYFPSVDEEGEEASWDKSGASYVVFLKSSAIYPTVVLDNEDIPQATLDAEPHFYLTPSSMKKIAVGKSGRPDFQLQILAHHPEGIDYATLEYRHTAGASARREFLAWDNSARAALDGPAHGETQGYVSTNPLDGHRGWWKDAGNEARGTYFCFTADQSKKDASNNPIFYGSPESYTLIVKVYSKNEGLMTEQQYTVFLEGSGPTVSIRSMRGWSNENEPSDPGTDIKITTTGETPPRVISAGGMLFTEPYIVNGNIQVAIDRIADQGILSAKWIVEEDIVDGESNSVYLNSAGTTLAKLKAYRDNPNAAGIQFYNEITNGLMSGDIMPPSNDPAALATDRAYNLKFNTKAWNGKDLWLYVIAQDGVQNLGFVLQKIHVYEEGDKPVANVPTLLPEITAKEQLYWDGTSNAGNWGNHAENRKNILDAQGIELTFTDDDGILRSDITITLKNLDSGIEKVIPVPANDFLNGRDYLISGNSRQWNGVLSQQLMAQTLYAGKNPMPSKLPDGLYELNIKITDNIAAKVAIDRGIGVESIDGDTPEPVTVTQKYFFGVQSDTPVIHIIAPTENSQQNRELVNITGTVISRLRIQKLSIRSVPQFLASRDLDLYNDPACLPAQMIPEITILESPTKRYTPETSPADFPETFTGNSAEDYYVYYWIIRNVDFDPQGLPGFSPTDDIRRFFLTTFDGLHNQGVSQRTVEIDTTPPDVTLDLFNYNRGLKDVNGKVPVEINAYDFNGIGVDPDNSNLLLIKWWVVRSSGLNPPTVPNNWNSPAPTEAADGTSGQIRTGSYGEGKGDDLGGGRYMIVFNTGNVTTPIFTDGMDYHLYAMAIDKAGNRSDLVKLTETVTRNNAGVIISRIDTPFTINQASDYPVLNETELTPQDNATVTDEILKGFITGEVYDDDGFGQSGIASGKYLQIRFPTVITGTHPNVSLTWADNWKGISGTSDPTDNSTFTFACPTTIDDYLKEDSWKYYQIRVIDEDTAGSLVPGSNYGAPPGKNPDGAQPSGTGYIGTATRQYPYNDNDPNNVAGRRGYYQFLLKNTAPQIHYYQFDPDIEHKRDVPQLDADGNPVIVGGQPVMISTYTESRPAFREMIKLRDTLKHGHISESTSVEEAHFYYGDVKVGTLKSQEQPFVGNKAGYLVQNGNEYKWEIPDAIWNEWLKRFDWVLDNNGNHVLDDNIVGDDKRMKPVDGMYSVSIVAYDAAGNQSQGLAWTFNKDNTGPVITFITDIISLTETPRLVSGKPNESTFISGWFRDTHSDIAQNYSYNIDSAILKETPITAGGGEHRGKSAQWFAEIPMKDSNGAVIRDGLHRLYIEGSDVAGNMSESNIPGRPYATQGIPFYLDRTAPVVSSPDNMIVTGGGKNASLKDYERVFSATYAVEDSADEVFTLSGLVYDEYLNGVTVSFYPGGGAEAITVELPFGNWTGGTGTPTDPYILWDSKNQLSVRKATRPDSGVGNHTPLVIKVGGNDETILSNNANLYVWELKVPKSRIYQILIATPSSTTDINVPHDDGRVRRQITVTAQDRANHNSAMQNWRFYLDDQSPKVQFINPQVPGAGYQYYTSANTAVTATRVPARMETLSMDILASDVTNIKEVRYFILRSFNGEGGDWRYYTSTGTPGWTSTTLPAAYANPANWPFLYNGDADGATPQTTVSRTLVDTTPTNSNMVLMNSIFGTSLPPGLYKVQLYVTDYSIAASGAGNPTIPAVNNPTVPAAAEVQFFVDNDEPDLNWKISGDPKDYYRTKDLTFSLTASDANAIAGYVVAELRQNNVKVSTATVNFTVVPVASSNPPTSTITITGITGLAVNGDDDGRYTLFLSIIDKTGKPATSGNTIDFTLDNKAPVIEIEPSGGVAAITGRVTLRGTFTKNAGYSPVSLVAFALEKPATPGVPGYLDVNNNVLPVNDVKDGETVVVQGLKSKGWHFDSDILRNTDDITLAKISEGLATANVTLPYTRYLTDYLATAVPVTNQTFNGDLISTKYGTEEKVQKLVIHFLAVDEVGNPQVKTIEYWVYPEGDRPEVQRISNPDDNPNFTKEERLLNGTIRIRGTAVDNVYVKNVWFRVYLNGTLKTFNMPKWDTSKTPWTAMEDIPANAQKYYEDDLIDITGTNHGAGWYMANGRGAGNVPWYADINTMGELNPTDPTKPNDIRIEVMVEDSVLIDIEDGGTGDYYVSKTGLFSKNYKSVEARVVIGAPRFEQEQVLNDISTTYMKDGTYDFGQWSSALEANVRGEAAYAVTVKHDIGIETIKWTQPNGSVVDLLSANHTPTSAGVSSGDITARAMPKKPLSGAITASIAVPRTFMIWEPIAGDSSSRPTDLSADQNVRHTIFTANANFNTGTGILLEMTENKDFEWLVVFDLDTDALEDGAWKGTAGYYLVSLSAQEISKPVGLITSIVAYIPIDNIVPEGMYTHNTRVAGTNASFGGVARDTGTVSGVDHVVLWFSRLNVSNEVVFVPWNERAAIPGTFVGTTDTGLTQAQRNDTGITGLPTVAAFANFRLPSTYDKDDTSGNYSSIVIDQHDPSGNNSHHGHKLPMGFANTGGDFPRSWYVELNSKEMESGLHTAHFIVYDSAGNARYYSQSLMNVNGIPQITGIRLGTDIRGDKGLDTIFTGNVPTGNNNNASAVALSRIKTAVGGATDIASGISEQIPIDTTRTNNVYSAVFDEPFNVRNRLLALEIEASEHSTGKPRYYRVEYVSNAQLISGAGNGANAIRNATTGIRAGRVYIINNPGSDTNKFPWGTLGAQGYRAAGAAEDSYSKGMAFLALENGADMTLPLGDSAYGTPSVWELNRSYYNQTTGNRTGPTGPLALNDVNYAGNATGSTKAEFVYAGNVFGNNQGTSIIDFNPQTNANADLSDFRPDGRPKDVYPFPSVMREATPQNPWLAHSLFIIRVFDRNANENELFGDFALLSIRVNNDDRTQPYSQLYDLNPKVEDADILQQYANPTAATPLPTTQNRTKGGLLNTGTAADPVKSGHIEPRGTRTRAGETFPGTSLTSTQMGGAATADRATIDLPWADPSHYFDFDTVSGDVILRGYAEDDQRIGSITLEFHNEPIDTALSTVILLNYASKTNGTSLLGVPTATETTGRVSFTETIDLNRHRVEWAYLWKTEEIPVTVTPAAAMMVGDINVRVVVRNLNNETTPAPKTASQNRQLQSSNNNTYDYFNPGFQAYTNVATNLFRRYNTLRVNIRPYISEILRDQNGINSRSRQGRYMLRRGEEMVINGFNLGGAADPALALPPNGNTTIAATLLTGGTGATNGATNGALSADGRTAFGLTDTPASRYRIFRIPTTAITGHGMISYTFNNQTAVNTGGGRGINTSNAAIRNPNYIQPWNTQRSDTEGSELWDDFTAVHIWQSVEENGGTDNGSFLSSPDWVVMDPSMSIDPITGVLYASHNEGGIPGSNNTATANAGLLLGSANNAVGTATPAPTATQLMRFRDPMIHSDVFRSPGRGADLSAATWYVTNIIGQSASTLGGQSWESYGGIYIRGPDGTGSTVDLSSGNNGGINNNPHFYLAESTWYNSSLYSPTGPNRTNPNYTPYTDQFLNPHIVTYIPPTGTAYEHVHVSYHDTKDGSIKYRYNRRGQAGLIENTANGSNDIGDNMTTRGNAAYIPQAWTNLDGGYDVDDTRAAAYATATLGGNIGEGARVVNYNTRSTSGNNVGEHNAIAVTSQGYPVIAYYDTGGGGKLKLAISRNVAPVEAIHWQILDNVITGLNQTGTGQYVSIAIDADNNIHIAALNASSGNLVYATGKLTPPTTSGTVDIDETKGTYAASGGSLTGVNVQVVDSLGTVGRWCKISLDASGNPWIAYQDAGNIGSREGVKLAYLDSSRFTKGADDTIYEEQDIDVYGVSVSGWETMHVPTAFRVENPSIGTGELGHIGLENFPTTRGTSNKTTGLLNFAAVSYLSLDKYRIAYYVK